MLHMPHGAIYDRLLSDQNGRLMETALPLRASSRPSIRPAIIIENIMEPGHGRLILRDGTDLPVGYCILQSQAADGCRGILIGNIRSIDAKAFLTPIKLSLGEQHVFAAHVISHSERHVRFVSILDWLGRRTKARFGTNKRPMAAIQ